MGNIKVYSFNFASPCGKNIVGPLHTRLKLFNSTSARGTGLAFADNQHPKKHSCIHSNSHHLFNKLYESFWYSHTNMTHSLIMTYF